jgi:hypothetical protein
VLRILPRRTALLLAVAALNLRYAVFLPRNSSKNESAFSITQHLRKLTIGGVLWETVLANLPDELGKMLGSTLEESWPDTDSIKAAILHEEQVPGAELRRGWHLRIK